MVLYLMAIQLSVTFITHLVRGQITSILIASAVIMFTLLSSGLTVHSLDLGSYIKWMELTSPLRWLLPVITAKEFNPETIQATTSHLLCRNKQVCYEQKNLMLSFKIYLFYLFLLGSKSGHYSADAMSTAQWYTCFSIFSVATR